MACCLCGSQNLAMFRKSRLRAPLTSDAFAITDAHYGTTGELRRCRACGLVQCTELGEVLSFYERLEDPAYVAGWDERQLQSARLLEVVARCQPSGRLLDIGAGSGILVQEALRRGYSAMGVEPSAWLCEQAWQRGLPVVRGTLPHHEVGAEFDVVTIVDVLEHVPDPVALLRAAAQALSSTGVGLVVTPDFASVAARMLGWRWWHRRVAHLSYHTPRTLRLALAQAGLRVERSFRPAWFFSCGYLAERVSRYLPAPLRLSCPHCLRDVTVRLNLHDSLGVVFRHDA